MPLTLSVCFHLALLGATQRGCAGPCGSDFSLPQAQTLRVSLASGLSEPAPSAPRTAQAGAGVAESATAAPASARQRSPARVAPASVEKAGSRSDAPDSVGLVEALEPHYYEHQDLDIPPFPLGELLEPAVGEKSPQVAGSVVLDIWIDDAGFVTRVATARTDLPEELATAMEKAMAQQHFAPAVRDGRAVHSHIRGELRYAPRPARNLLGKR